VKSVFHLPLSIFHHPPSIFHLPSSIFHLPSSIFHLPSSIFHLPSAETQVWLEFAVKCGYLEPGIARELYTTYDHILGKVVKMIVHPEQWVLGK